MTTVRLLGISTSFPLRSNSSAGVFVKRLYEHLPGHWQVSVVCPDDDIGTLDGAAAEQTIRLCPARYAPRRLQVLAQKSGGLAAAVAAAPWRLALIPPMLMALALRALAEGRRADLLHANWAICGAIAVLAGRLLGRPVVTTLRGDDVTRADASLFDRLLLKIAVGGSVAVICVSSSMAAQLRARFPARSEAIHVCLNGVSSELLEVERAPSTPGLLRVAAVGSLIHRKGLDVLIRGVSAAAHRARIRVRVAGAGPELIKLRSLTNELGLEHQVEFIGEIPPDAIPGFLAAADVLVLASRSEGRPNAVIEALASGLPVICTDLPGVAGLLEHGVNGWRIPVNDCDALASALDDAFQCPDKLKHFGMTARQRMAEQRSGWADTGACYDAVFQAAIGISGQGKR